LEPSHCCASRIFCGAHEGPRKYDELASKGIPRSVAICDL
jgi:hypothetical protein